MRPGENPFVLFLTTVVSHITMISTPYLFYKRHYVYELCAATFGLIASLMYHTCDSFDVTIILSEKQWHRLDNVGIISMMGVWYVFVCCFTDPIVERACKYCTLLITIVFQQLHPWDVRFTAIPIMLFGLLPVVQYCFVLRRLPSLNLRYFLIGAGCVLLALPFFVLGLNDAEDPYRVYHGLWHFFGGLSSICFWLMIRSPGVTGQLARPTPMMAVKGDALL